MNPDSPYPEDGLSAARGAVIGLALGALCWLFLAAVGYLVVGS